MTKEEKDISLLERFRKLRETPGGAFGDKALKHGGTVRAVAVVAAKQILDVMQKRNVEIVTFQRKHLPELFGMNAIQPPRAGQPPLLKKTVREHLRARGLKVEYAKGLIDFVKITPKKNPNL